MRTVLRSLGVVSSAILVASLGLISPAGAQVAAVGHLKCYQVKDLLAGTVDRPKVPYTLDLIANAAGFPNSLGCSLKLGAKRVCAEVTKQNVTPPPPGGGPTIPPNASSVFLSYKIKCPKQSVPSAPF